jgi:hypothetical protein
MKKQQEHQNEQKGKTPLQIIRGLNPGNDLPSGAELAQKLLKKRLAKKEMQS